MPDEGGQYGDRAERNAPAKREQSELENALQSGSGQYGDNKQFHNGVSL